MSDNIFFDKKKLKYCGKNVIIGKNCHIASHVSISGGAGKFTMGDYSTISNHSSIHCASSDYADVSLDLPSVDFKDRFGGEVSDVSIGNFVTVGSHSCLLPGVFLPNGFACGSYSLLRKEVFLPWSLYVGIPAKFLKPRNIDKIKNTEIFKNFYKNENTF